VGDFSGVYEVPVTPPPSVLDPDVCRSCESDPSPLPYDQRLEALAARDVVASGDTLIFSVGPRA
jgi:hypothetical protein